ncbi:hypothetical protein ATO10_13174 [Actibacterium atlanticum]|uniref:TPR repeat-containing protein n=1 Tax=Actibacterium atlanticum TaxID=1461693 RepID=A0A058ZHL9_9RHOB|nr:tetratricopeptide repeat protein [Actibacterium atlanticum]KCV81134.1 hypothetical protein ATO10_13174 [Actibacterium atlanticum]
MPKILPRLFGLVSIAAASLVAVPAAAQNGLSGSYLAARHASYQSDYKAAAQYYTQALARDPSNAELMENALLAFVGLGQLDKALPIARRLEQLGVENQAANLMLMADQIKRGAFQQVLDDLEAGRNVGALVQGLTTAWSEFGAGRMSDAIKAFEAVEADGGLEMFGVYHKAMALAAVGDFESAAQLLKSEAGQPIRLTRRGVLAEVQILSQLERNDEAITLLEELFGLESDPGISALRERLAAGEALPFTSVRSAQDGVAEVFFTLASALNGEANDTYTLMYARAAEYLRPAHVDALLLSAGLLENQELYDLANETYLRVPADDPGFYAAELGRSNTLEASGKPDAAIEVLTQLSKNHPDVALVHSMLGDSLSREQRFGEAVKAYDKAIGLFDADERRQWVVYYARGIAHEREKIWPRAEADFRKALALEPDQPNVLNYLGYSFVEMRLNLDEALSMIERAVAARPDSGYIVDSLGWVLYRLGRYQEAVPHMERAAELEPIDPIVNNHLGDVLWAVGRYREAEFQWKRALSFVDPDDIPDELNPDRIRRKIEVGLSKVLEEEGAEPLAVAEGE